MATKITIPIPRDKIGESFVWRDWFQKLSDRVFGTAAAIDVPIATQYGGTGLTTYNTGDILYSPSSNTLTRLPAPSDTSFLQMTAAGVPSWIAKVYGAYHDTSTTTATSATTAYVMSIGSVDLENGVSIVSGTKLTVTNAGIYNLQFSAQLANPNSNIADVSIWLQKNGTNIAASAGTNGVPAKHGANNGLQIVSWNWVLSLAAADYIELYWHSDATGVQLITIPAITSPAVPQSPALIVTIVQV